MKTMMKMKLIVPLMALFPQLCLLGGNRASFLHPWNVHTPFSSSINHSAHQAQNNPHSLSVPESHSLL